MPKRRIPLTHPKVRSILTDMLPFEVPPTFSNRGFYSFLLKNGVEIEGQDLRWISDTNALDSTITLLFGVKAGTTVNVENVTEWGKKKTRRSVRMGRCEMSTIPFNFRVAHGIDGRVLTVVHPRNQVSVAEFYARYSSLIIYYSSLSEFSIRRPVSVSRFVFFNDHLHKQKVDHSASGIEMVDREYEQLGSYFVYRKYRNIHRFFESYKYHRCEKKYTAMVQVDVNKCFDSIYTHSISWSTIGKSQAKFDIKKSNTTFAGQFDNLMQKLNQRETNGIVIGPEFSRIFAETILQSIDVEVVKLLTKEGLIHKRDYEIFRYVDDYFIFYNKESEQTTIIQVLQETLKAKKLSINAAKVKPYQKPIITEITVAKDRISSLLNSQIDPKVETTEIEEETKLSCKIDSNQLIIKYKTIIKESNVKYDDLLNYTFAITENKIEKLLKAYKECRKTPRDQRHLLNALLAIIEFSFFVYSASPKVNHTVRICRMIQTSTDFLHLNAILYELKHLLFKYVHDNIVQLLEKNTMSAFHEVESLYLITALSQTGKEYWLPESTLAKYFLINIDQQSGDYSRPAFLNYFSITVLLSYIRNKVRYQKLRAFIERHARLKLENVTKHCPRDAEALMLMLDLIVCPDVSVQTKQALGNTFGLDAAELAEVQAANNHWFTAWGPKFNLGMELDAKRSREVY
ncbi:antiviral reverse transcriptase Drt3b [Granulicella sp. S156]|uniref:antiviral reverse transcriptase Drt3b n=1 Tax=Granulicella sp. S156 TaxID=1747224 RepID=UPI00131AAC22|nr:antiviral reverse transcriptase Drt3b [Granulicella sp. S156]